MGPHREERWGISELQMLIITLAFQGLPFPFPCLLQYVKMVGHPVRQAELIQTLWDSSTSSKRNICDPPAPQSQAKTAMSFSLLLAQPEIHRGSLGKE